MIVTASDMSATSPAGAGWMVAVLIGLSFLFLGFAFGISIARFWRPVPRSTTGHLVAAMSVTFTMIGLALIWDYAFDARMPHIGIANLAIAATIVGATITFVTIRETTPRAIAPWVARRERRAHQADSESHRQAAHDRNVARKQQRLAARSTT